ncbi:TPA: OmpA family protein [Vibrio cholerae]|uniref:OmpA family protein n=1 Tax=Vibrio paracholerae TaxID=650003 RepID=A0AAX1QMK2_9VIBR|nr:MULTISPECIES: OmpA family protein [Vibrio]EGR1113341.1 OmpA family protein [Vibrio cholerae]EGR1835592.1 OmpA family protein [Vibrio cholerae]EGR2083330.1 OmpA family protein [Vibrio cholerae]EJL6897957.1 OmpA family protein [Vibrio cholerae]EKF6142787.1 OmpA family protein [Vibrio cholerae]
MLRKNSLMFIGVTGLLTACAGPIRDDNLILDIDWEPDIYNMVVTHVSDPNNFRFIVHQAPRYIENSPHEQACLEIDQPLEPNRYYLANLNTYGLTEVRTCEGEYWLYSNLVDPYKSLVAGFNVWDPRSYRLNKMYSYENGDKNSTNRQGYPLIGDSGIDGLDAYLIGEKNLRLVFENLFPVNEFELTQASKETLLQLIQKLNQLPVKELVIYGVADSSGLYAKNRVLADRRALAVRNFLIEEGVRGISIMTRGSVENGLETAEQRVKQRRFSIDVRLKNNGK